MTKPILKLYSNDAVFSKAYRYNIDGIRWNFKEGEREVKTEDSS